MLAEPLLPHLIMRERHEVRGEVIVPQRLHAAIAAAGARSFRCAVAGEGVTQGQDVSKCSHLHQDYWWAQLAR